MILYLMYKYFDKEGIQFHDMNMCIVLRFSFSLRFFTSLTVQISAVFKEVLIMSFDFSIPNFLKFSTKYYVTRPVAPRTIGTVI